MLFTASQYFSLLSLLCLDRTTHGNPPLAIGGPPVEDILDNQSPFPPVVTGATIGLFFKKNEL